MAPKRRFLTGALEQARGTLALVDGEDAGEVPLEGVELRVAAALRHGGDVDGAEGVAPDLSAGLLADGAA